MRLPQGTFEERITPGEASSSYLAFTPLLPPPPHYLSSSSSLVSLLQIPPPLSSSYSSSYSFVVLLLHPHIFSSCITLSFLISRPPAPPASAPRLLLLLLLCFCGCSFSSSFFSYSWSFSPSSFYSSSSLPIAFLPPAVCNSKMNYEN